MSGARPKVAVVLFNLGGPDGPKAVRPFLFKLFSDPRIVAAPAPLRWLLAQLISRLRAAKARANYALMGGGSPILPETERQAAALETALAGSNAFEAKVFIAMRYWQPFAADAAAAAAAWGAQEAILLPLYPQFSTSTTSSAMDAWSRVWRKPTRTVCCYPADARFAAAHAARILEAWSAAGSPPAPRVLFSAHGLPERIIEAGDSYQWQVEQTVAAVSALLPETWEKRVCYQSRVGPLAWIGPETEREIERAAEDGVGVIVSPIAFVSEHIETLVELDIEYRELAHERGVPFYIRAPALGESAPFIEALADIAKRAYGDARGLGSGCGRRLCPSQFAMCPMSLEAAPP
jgi:ferrochelatase